MMNLITPPKFQDEQKSLIAAMLHIILLTVLVASFLIAIAAWLGGHIYTPPLMVVGAGLILAAIWFMHRGRLTEAGLIFLLSFTALLTFLAFVGDGVHDTALVAYPVLIVAASLALNRRWFNFFVGLAILSVGLIVFGEINGVILTPFDISYLLTDAIIVGIILVITAIALHFLTENLFDSLTRAQHNELGLIELNAELQREIIQRRQAEQTLREAEALLWRRNQELTLLNQVGHELNATLDTAQVNERLLQSAVETIGAEGATIWLREVAPSQPDKAAAGLICRAVYRQDQDRTLLNLRLDPGQGIAGWVAQTGESAIVGDVAGDSRFFAGVDGQSGFQTRSLLTVPLQVHGKSLGVLQVANKLAGNFSADDLTFTKTLAASAAVALHNAQLVETLRQRTDQLERQNEELDAYAHTVAHDLKTPLARLVGFAEFLAEAHQELSDEERSQYLRLVAQNGRKMDNIINELLLLAGVRQAKEVKLTPLEMVPVVQAAQNRLAGLIETAQTNVIEPTSWPTAIGYGPWVEEVWVNYLSNAIKYGGQPPQVELGATALPAGQICFWVRDNGPGLTPEEQARLFTPFTRLAQSRARGHGLGLSIVRRIVEKLDGQVGVESQGAGQGCTFWFTLPAP